MGKRNHFQNELSEFCLISLGALPGALLRWQFHNDLLVNILGASILGLLCGSACSTRRNLFVGEGFCGALTTFSGWMLSSIQLIVGGNWISGSGLIVSTLGLGLIAGILGFLIGKQFR